MWQDVWIVILKLMFLEQRKGVGGKRKESGDDIWIWNQHNHIFIQLKFDFKFLFERIEVPTQHWRLKIHWILGIVIISFISSIFFWVLFNCFCFSFYFPFILLSFFFCISLFFSPCSIIVFEMLFVSFLLCTKLVKWRERKMFFFSFGCSSTIVPWQLWHNTVK